MRVVNILFNHKKSVGDDKVAGVEKIFVDYTKLFTSSSYQVLSIFKPKMVYKSALEKFSTEVMEVNAMGHGDILTILRMAWRIFRFKPDVIICHSGRALFMAKAATLFSKTPIIGVNHGSNINKFLSADYIFNVNSYFNQQIIDLGKPADRNFVVPNMFEIPEDFTEPKARKFHKPFRIGSLGRLSGEKGYRFVFRAIAELKKRGMEVEFYLGGTGNEKQDLEKLAKDLEVEKNIKFLGWVDDKEAFFKEIDVFILSSLFETFGIVLLEAMLYKVPIISSKIWGPMDIIEEGTDGLFFSRDNEEEIPALIANLVEKLSKNKEYAENLAENAYKKFHQKYSSQVVGNQIKSILGTIISKNK